jgi:hypothetical protein
LFGTPIAETILASVHVRARQQAEHMDATIRSKRCKTPCEEGAVHIGGAGTAGIFSRPFSLSGGRRVAWIVRLVKTGADGEKQSVDVVTINRPDDLIDITNCQVAEHCR